MNGHLRPHLSAAKPKVMAPIERNIRTKVIPQVISALVFPNSFDSAVTVKETVKKSNASLYHHCALVIRFIWCRAGCGINYQVQPANAIRKNCHCLQLNDLRVVNGFGGTWPGGLRVVTLVAIYLPTLIFAIL